MCGFFPTFSQHQRHQHLHPGIQRRPASVLQDVGSRELPADPDQVWFSKESQVVRAVWGWLLLLRALLLVPSKSGECTVLRCSRETTYSESYDEESATKAVQNSDNKETASEEPEEVDAEEASLRYRVLQALVGTKRLDELELEIRDKVLQRMAGGAGQLLKSFKLFSSGKGEIGPNQLMSVCQVKDITMLLEESNRHGRTWVLTSADEKQPLSSADSTSTKTEGLCITSLWTRFCRKTSARVSREMHPTMTNEQNDTKV
mmetsp:Transcript_18480/g.60662  ORF Transcript_18480/g.60662 Transcript_18480/m.60662 type:complete len:260 (-) Transcript_18480:27-806(-)